MIINIYINIKTQRNILKWYGSKIFLKQLRSSTNRLTPKTSAKHKFFGKHID